MGHSLVRLNLEGFGVLQVDTRQATGDSRRRPVRKQLLQEPGGRPRLRTVLLAAAPLAPKASPPPRACRARCSASSACSTWPEKRQEQRAETAASRPLRSSSSECCSCHGIVAATFQDPPNPVLQMFFLRFQLLRHDMPVSLKAPF